ncbi:MAG: addiction module protein [Pseudomonadota bacterium]
MRTLRWKAWAAEIERRIAEIESGAVQLAPAAEALTRARTAPLCSSRGG